MMVSLKHKQPWHQRLKHLKFNDYVSEATVFNITVFLWLSAALTLQIMLRNKNGEIMDITEAYYGQEDEGEPGRRLNEPTTQIYAMKDATNGEFGEAEWGQVSKAWDSKASYADIANVMSTSSGLPSIEGDERVVLVLHNHVKMASETLLNACYENLKGSCTAVDPHQDRIGLDDARELSNQVAKCEQSHYFCASEWNYRAPHFPVTFTSDEPTHFIHLFPYRNFDDWAIKAMKKVHDDNPITGCKSAARSLKSCNNGWLELDVLKYTKKTMTYMMERTSKEQNEQVKNHFLLYDYSKVEETVAQVSSFYQIPMLEHIDKPVEVAIEEEGTCPDETLAKFHECYDDQL